MGRGATSAGMDSLCIEVTARCPLRCVHCSTCACPERAGMADLNAVARYLEASAPLQEIYLSGGEPFENPELAAFAAVACARASRVVIYSSGSRLASDGVTALSVDALLRLAEIGISRIDLSLYSGSAEVHDTVTGTRGSWATTLLSAGRIREAGIDLGVHFVPLPVNDRCLVEVAALARALRASRLHILAPTRQGRASHLPGLGLSPAFMADVDRLRVLDHSFQLVLSSEVRWALGDPSVTERDGWRSGLLDFRGNLHPGEGRRLRLLPEPMHGSHSLSAAVSE